MLHDGEKLHEVAISNESPRRKKMDRHYTNMTKPEQQRIDQMLASYGFTPDQAATDYMVRRYVCMKETLRWVNSMDVQPVHELGLFAL